MSTFRTHDAVHPRSARAILITLIAAGALALSGCGGGTPDEPEETTTVTVAPSPPRDGSPPPPSEASTEECSGLTGDEAAQQWVEDVPAPPQDPSWAWDAAAAVTDGYDECAALSWIVLPVEGGTASSPFHIMLFHAGQYLGTATESAYPFEPTVERISGGEISVTYAWVQDGDANAAPSGSSTASFTWDDASGSVSMSGDVPPEGGSAPTPVAIPTSCDAILGEAARQDLEEFPLLHEAIETDHLECQWGPEGADTTHLHTIVTRVNDDEAIGELDALRDDEGFSCSETQGGTRCEKTWDNENYPVTDGRTVFLRDTVLIDTGYSNLAPREFTSGIVESIFGTE